jgi:hypothetical protein
MRKYLKEVKLIIKKKSYFRWLREIYFYAEITINRIKLTYCKFSKKKQKQDLKEALDKYKSFQNMSQNSYLFSYFNDLYFKYDNFIHESIQNILLPKKKISSVFIVSKVKELISNGMIIWDSNEIIKSDTFQKIKNTYLKEGYVVCPFKLATSEKDSFIEASKKLNYKLQGRKEVVEGDNISTNCTLPKNRSDAKAIQYLHKIVSSSSIQYPLKVRELLFEISCYLMEQEKLEICSDQLWYSFSIKKLESEHDAAQNWHYDSDALEWIKIFTFFTDVDKKSGAHQAILGTHHTGAKSIKIRSYGVKRIPDHVINMEYDKKQSFDLLAGSIVFGNTKCLHRAQPLEKEKYRLMHQFVLTISPGSFIFPKLYQYNSHSLEAVKMDDRGMK